MIGWSHKTWAEAVQIIEYMCRAKVYVILPDGKYELKNGALQLVKVDE